MGNKSGGRELRLVLGSQWPEFASRVRSTDESGPRTAVRLRTVGGGGKSQGVSDFEIKQQHTVAMRAAHSHDRPLLAQFTTTQCRPPPPSDRDPTGNKAYHLWVCLLAWQTDVYRVEKDEGPCTPWTQPGPKSKMALHVSDDWEDDDDDDDDYDGSLAIPRLQSSLPKLCSCARQTCLCITYSSLGKWALVFWDGVGTILKRRSSALVQPGILGGVTLWLSGSFRFCTCSATMCDPPVSSPTTYSLEFCSTTAVTGHSGVMRVSVQHISKNWHYVRESNYTNHTGNSEFSPLLITLPKVLISAAYNTGLKMCLKMIALAKLNQLPKLVDYVTFSSLLNVAILATFFFPPKPMPRVVISAANSGWPKVVVPDRPKARLKPIISAVPSDQSKAKLNLVVSLRAAETIRLGRAFGNDRTATETIVSNYTFSRPEIMNFSLTEIVPEMTTFSCTFEPKENLAESTSFSGP
ncbi:hypothetical protein K438DRAFT_2170994 [Mycena galopus ATCC 62051]|nr:hypothetical protein K438DRAFT_2170994 [Mycena galopus ATCC 62051]